MKLAICVATMKQPPDDVVDITQAVSLYGHPGPGDVPLAISNSATWPQVYVKYNHGSMNTGVVGSYQLLYEKATEEILCFMHDDVIIRERGWDERVLKEFEDPKVGLVGFGGALWHGDPSLYKVPYQVNNLRRGDYMSNVDDAEVHGVRFTGSQEVAVLDGYVLIVRRSVLSRIGGWKQISRGCDFFCYDYALCAMVRRLGFTVRVLGVRCHHRGGTTSVTNGVKEITSPEAYESSHRWFYNEFRDVMPWDVRRHHHHTA